MKKRRMLSGALALVMSLMVLASPALAAEAVSDGEMPAAVETEPAVPETEETTTPGEPPVESQEPPAEEPADPAPEQPEEPAPPEESVPESPVRCLPDRRCARIMCGTWRAFPRGPSSRRNS